MTEQRRRQLYLHGGFNLQVEFDNLLIANPDRHVTGRRHLGTNYGEREAKPSHFGMRADLETERPQREVIGWRRHDVSLSHEAALPGASNCVGWTECCWTKGDVSCASNSATFFPAAAITCVFAVRRENRVYYSMFKIAVTELFGKNCNSDFPLL